MPEYLKIFDDVNRLNHLPYCFCYQYEINDLGFGCFGFNTKKSEQLINDIFNEITFWNPKELEEQPFSINKKGISFYKESSAALIKEVLKYKLDSKKNSFFQKSNKQIILELIYPRLFKIFDKKVYSAEVVNELLIDNYHFLIHQFYTPQGGNCFLSFDLDLKTELRYWANKNDVLYEELDDINQLKPW